MTKTNIKELQKFLAFKKQQNRKTAKIPSSKILKEKNCSLLKIISKMFILIYANHKLVKYWMWLLKCWQIWTNTKKLTNLKSQNVDIKTFDFFTKYCLQLGKYKNYIKLKKKQWNQKILVEITWFKASLNISFKVNKENFDASKLLFNLFIGLQSMQLSWLAKYCQPKWGNLLIS